tara:strand:+ start:197 stop:307 length:111 start_codon:yes stop_codon:yes gene_type:complete
LVEVVVVEIIFQDQMVEVVEVVLVVVPTLILLIYMP